MATTCSIPGCQSNSNNVMLFQIPSGKLGEKWIVRIKDFYPNFSPENGSKICGYHFKREKFVNSERMELIRSATPTVFASVRCVHISVLRKQTSNTAAGMNSSARDTSVIRNNTNSIAVSVPSVPNPSYNTIGTRPTTRPTNHAGLQEHSNLTVAESSRSLRTRKRKIVCGHCNAIDSEV